jgi:hypothetical protein
MAGVASGEFTPGVAAPDVTELEAGAQVDTGPFILTVERARVLDELPGISESNDSTRVIALVVTVAANGSRTLSGAMLADSVALQGVGGLSASTILSSGEGVDDATSDDAPVTAPNVVVIADGSRLDALQPGLEYEVAMVWEQSSEFAAPTEVEVVVSGRTLRASSIDRSMEWLDRAHVAVGSVPVTPPDSDARGDGG